MYHSWELPDKHVAYVPVIKKKKPDIEIDELDHLTFRYHYKSNEPNHISTSLCPNIIHSIDAYIARLLIRMCYKAGIQICPIHDA